MQRFLVLAAKRYSFEDNGKKLEGVNVFYCDAPEKTVDSIGMAPMKLNAPIELSKEFFATNVSCPAFYELNFTMKPDAKGKPSLSLNGAKFIEPFNLAPKNFNDTAKNGA